MSDSNSFTDAVKNAADAVKGVSNGFLEFLEGDSRGIGMKSDMGARFIEVPTPAWFPDSLLRSLKRNLYMNMVNNATYKGQSGDKANDGKSLDFYKDTSGDGLISNLINGAIKSVVSVAANQIMSITNKVDSVVNGISSLFSDNNSRNQSLMSMIRETSQNPFLAAQPYVRIYGIHVTEKVRDNILIMQSILKMANNIIQNTTKKDDDPNKKSLNSYLDNASKALMVAFANMVSDGSQSAKLKSAKTPDEMLSIMMSADFRLHGFAEQMMLNSLPGTYTMFCKLPYFPVDGSTLFSSNGEGGFSGGGANTMLGSIISQFSGMNFSWSKNIDWSSSSIYSACTPLKCKFSIFNDTLEHFMTNIGFIWTFTATTKAVTDACFIRAPYLYNIEIPGGIRYKMCSCTMQISPRGKTRMICSDAASKTYVGLFKSIYGLTVNPNAIKFAPDAYDITISFNSQLPDLWNFAAGYLFNGSDVPTIGDKTMTKMTKFVTDFETTMNR